MTDTESFALALWTEPENVTARLAFIDFLEENDDPRAEGLRGAKDFWIALLPFSIVGELVVGPHREALFGLPISASGRNLILATAPTTPVGPGLRVRFPAASGVRRVVAKIETNYGRSGSNEFDLFVGTMPYGTHGLHTFDNAYVWEPSEPLRPRSGESGIEAVFSGRPENAATIQMVLEFPHPVGCPNSVSV